MDSLQDNVDLVQKLLQLCKEGGLDEDREAFTTSDPNENELHRGLTEMNSFFQDNGDEVMGLCATLAPWFAAGYSTVLILLDLGTAFCNMKRWAGQTPSEGYEGSALEDWKDSPEDLSKLAKFLADALPRKFVSKNKVSDDFSDDEAQMKQKKKKKRTKSSSSGSKSDKKDKKKDKKKNKKSSSSTSSNDKKKKKKAEQNKKTSEESISSEEDKPLKKRQKSKDAESHENDKGGNKSASDVRRPKEAVNNNTRESSADEKDKEHLAAVAENIKKHGEKKRTGEATSSVADNDKQKPKQERRQRKVDDEKELVDEHDVAHNGEADPEEEEEAEKEK